jgi:hypothetical protein
MAANPKIYTGFWTNWIDGPVAGATLTLTSQDGAYLVAFLALFIHVSGASFWRLVSYAIFQKRAQPEQSNVVILQQQTVLRNGQSAISSFRLFARLTIRSRYLRQNLPLLFWAAINFIGFLAAGILSSRVTSTRSEVLLLPAVCGAPLGSVFGPPTPPYVPDYPELEVLNPGGWSGLFKTSNAYALICYKSENLSDGCTTFGRKTPSWNSSLQPGCPFGGLCYDNMTFVVDSGYIASDLNLGINSHRTDRMSLRLREECAPLKNDGYMSIYTGNNVSSLFQPSKSSYFNSSREEAEAIFGQPVGPFSYEAFFYGRSTGNKAVPSPATFVWNNGTFARSFGASVNLGLASL